MTSYLEKAHENFQSPFPFREPFYGEFGVAKLASGKVIAALRISSCAVSSFSTVRTIPRPPPPHAGQKPVLLSGRRRRTRITGFSGRFLRSFFLPSPATVTTLTGQAPHLCVHYPCKAGAATAARVLERFNRSTLLGNSPHICALSHTPSRPCTCTLEVNLNRCRTSAARWDFVE